MQILHVGGMARVLLLFSYKGCSDKTRYIVYIVYCIFADPARGRPGQHGEEGRGEICGRDRRAVRVRAPFFK